MMKSSAQIVRNSGMKDVDWETICTLKVNLVNTTSHSLYNAPSSAPNSLAGNRGAFWLILITHYITLQDAPTVSYEL